MNPFSIQKIGLILGHALVGWALCAATMGLGMAITTEQTALIIHALAAPIIFTGISRNYFTKFHYTTPLPTALIFVGTVIFVDFFLVALVMLGSLDMFASLLGTWLPFALIFTATYVTGLYSSPRPEQPLVTQP